MAKKKASKRQADDGQQFMQRLQVNLDFFRKHQPTLYKILSTLDLKNVELVVTPGRDDVDMIAYGHSCYKGLAKEFSESEAAGVLAENPEDKPIQTFAPPSAGSYWKRNFGNSLIQSIILHSPLRHRPFRGYIRGNFFPSMVFLGVGLGYHIDWLTKRSPIVNGIIIERDPEKFAVSLYTVDWPKICSRFSRKGHTLTFAVGKANTEQDIRTLVSHFMAKDVPFYPFFSIYYNHLADIEIARGVMATAQDLSVISSNWIDYDNDIVRLKNTVHNVRQGIRFLSGRPDHQVSQPVAIVGSGPSIDERIEELKHIRERVTVMSAGTGLRPLLAAGIIPDFHVELDPGFDVFRSHEDVDHEKLQQITLLAVNEINPRVAALFGEVVYYFKVDNALPYLLEIEDQAFGGCNPTVTNAALAIAYAMGVSRVFLFGTDYGFVSENRDHADHSVYGEKGGLEYARKLVSDDHQHSQKPDAFEVPSVSGGTVLTRSHYYSAKRSVEELIFQITQAGKGFRVYNCSEGAAIERTQWLQAGEVEENLVSGVALTPELIRPLARQLPKDSLDRCLPAVQHELTRICKHFTRLLKEARLAGRKDLCTVVNHIRYAVEEFKPIAGQPTSRAQMYVHQLIVGSLKHFLYVGLCHGMACQDDELKPFLATWKNKFLEFLDTAPSHFGQVVMNDLNVETDPWTSRNLYDSDPGFEGMMPLQKVKIGLDP